MSKLTALGSKEAEMKIIGCDLHAAQQTIAMLDGDTGEVVEKTLRRRVSATPIRSALPNRIHSHAQYLPVAFDLDSTRM